ncbi:MAG TPA: acyl-CoA dehydrogenase family protein [Aurantimonas sp.]|uniref:Acyl-CoA dehydrogenase n=1 Tax=Aurantimonas marianensis TaxID=2920428 RepID=A0A9X2HE65_9HYPH|nr:acyl-CoA dehydrogenase [Aurantimonas marianensis]
MRHDPYEATRLEELSDRLAVLAAARDRDGEFPHEAFAVLESGGYSTRPPVGSGETAQLLRLLAAIGRGDLSTGRVFEGHVNALQLVYRYGTSEQAAAYRAKAREGELFGVWNTDAPDDPLRLEKGHYSGKKNYASGVDGLSQAIVTAPTAAGRQMMLAPLAAASIDRSWWRPLGMRASGSHIIDLTGVTADAEHALGQPDDYIREPWFSGGAIRFAAVHVGGMHAVLDTALAHLTSTGRAADPHQSHRLARMGIAVESGYGWIDRAAEAWGAAESAPDDAGPAKALLAYANAARSAVEANALLVLETAERAVGAAGFNAPHPLERLVRDLRTYLRQPNPDGALRSLGEAMAAGTWHPGSRGRA